METGDTKSELTLTEDAYPRCHDNGSNRHCEVASFCSTAPQYTPVGRISSRSEAYCCGCRDMNRARDALLPRYLKHRVAHRLGEEL
eukprot:CAMPEP_0184380568 /NCGR_PEP_ID=MMETSP0007-20130409/4856_1 /TAXON_ID=97485 /ORGANISM="Prymnesium parvum, Strain Texoma1" /LENGTH=85 /DNA_ID=CAMNT_0026725851 /DNA_START=455 /DNA_END=712 /DNA_ORIENTATION=-